MWAYVDLALACACDVVSLTDDQLVVPLVVCIAD